MKAFQLLCCYYLFASIFWSSLINFLYFSVGSYIVLAIPSNTQAKISFRVSHDPSSSSFFGEIGGPITLSVTSSCGKISAIPFTMDLVNFLIIVHPLTISCLWNCRCIPPRGVTLIRWLLSCLTSCGIFSQSIFIIVSLFGCAGTSSIHYWRSRYLQCLERFQWLNKRRVGFLTIPFEERPGLQVVFLRPRLFLVIHMQNSTLCLHRLLSTSNHL